jgi:hypothetical protein
MNAAKQLNQAMIKHFKSNGTDQLTLDQELCIAREAMVNELEEEGK